MKKYCLFILLVSLPVLFSFPLRSQPGHQRNLLTGTYPLARIKQIFEMNPVWKPFPGYTDRNSWEQLPHEVKLIAEQEADKALNFEWPSLPATAYLEFAETGNRSHYEEIYFRRRTKLADLVIGELIDGRGKYIDQIINGIWAICEETSWTLPAHISGQRNGFTPLPEYDDDVVALFSAETGSELSWIYYFLKNRLDSVTPLVSSRMEYEIQRRILEPVMDRDDFWWMGLQGNSVNNWNPWVISNWLTCDLIMERDPDLRARSVGKAMRCLDNFLNQYPDDGGCDEGPGYWGVAGGALFDCLDFLYSSSKGEINIFHNPLIRNIGDYICKAHISNRYFINFADASAITGIDPDIVFRFGKMTDNNRMMGFAAWSLRRSGYSNGSYRFGRRIHTIFSYKEISEYAPAEPLMAGFWLPDIQVFGARSSEGSVTGLYLAGKGGNNAESHNHNDVGNFIVYLNGRPAIIDAGVGTYTKKTFSDQRYSIWTMQSQYHNLPTINGIQQKNGSRYRAKDVHFSAGSKIVTFSLDISGAYPEEAGVIKWIRSLTFQRRRSIQVAEDFDLNKNSGNSFLTFMTPCSVSFAERQVILTEKNSGNPFKLYIRYDPRQMTAESETIKIDDTRLSRVWGDELARIKFTIVSRRPAQKIIYTISEEH